MARIPYFPFFADDFLVGTMGMSAEERGVYITLLCIQFANSNRIAFALQTLSRMCASEVQAVQHVLDLKFDRDESGWFNPRLSDEFEKAQSKRKAMSENAKQRWNKEKDGDAEAMQLHSQSTNNQNQNQNQNQKTNKKRRGKAASPSLEEVREYCKERGSKVDPEQFHDHYTANGWKQSNGNAIRDWRAAVRTWEKRQGGFNNGQPPKERLRI